MTVLAGHRPPPVSGPPSQPPGVVTSPATFRPHSEDHRTAVTSKPPARHPGTVSVDRRFAVVPEWVIDAPISDTAFRLYSILLRYGQTSGQRMPGRATLARRLKKKSTDTVDRALRELVELGAVRVEHRRDGKQHLSNLYHLITDAPGDPAQAPDGSGRIAAATPPSSAPQTRPTTSNTTPQPDGAGRARAATGPRTDAAGMAAPMRPDPEAPTQTTPPSTIPRSGSPTAHVGGGGGSITEDNRQLLTACGIPNLDALAAHCQQLRQTVGKPTGRWTARQLLAVLERAVTVDGWPAAAAVPALLAVAADPTTASPMRLTAPGPWWDLPHRPAAAVLTADEQTELDQLNVRLEQLPDSGVGARYTARTQLTAEHQPRTRLTIARRAMRLVTESQEAAS